MPLHLLPNRASTSSNPLRLFSTSSRLPSKQPPEKLTLTHLSPVGTAHMVSITTKPPTSRTATAICSIHFSSPTAMLLIRENRAKKGDVLGVARIAGIMAAKRAADLIPLCHPIAITHVMVDVELAGQEVALDEDAHEVPTVGKLGVSLPRVRMGQNDTYAGSSSTSHSSSNPPSPMPSNAPANPASPPPPESSPQNNRIDIIATVSCEGKTGVEMEALTAASTAALTVYDMCKAVDKGMRIDGLRVVRKEGGRSGTWVEGVAVG